MSEDRASGAGAAGMSTALEHLQGAALQLIAAFRAVLDVAEDLISDGGGPTADAGSDPSADASADPPKRSPRVTRIQVS